MVKCLLLVGVWSFHCLLASETLPQQQVSAESNKVVIKNHSVSDGESKSDRKLQGSQAPKEKNETVVVIGQRRPQTTEATEDTQALLKTPGAMGDPLQAVFTLPGVVYAGSDTSGEPAVRGSSPNDNGYQIDFFPAGYIFHIFGDSIFNENIIHDFKLYSSAFGAEYGNATGGMFDVTLREPKNQPLKTTLDYSFLRTGVFVESGVSENQAFYLSYRHSLIHLYISEGDEEDGISIYNPPKSQDYQGKYFVELNDENTLTFSINAAKDNVRVNILDDAPIAIEDPDFAGDLSYGKSFENQGVTWDRYGGNGSHLRVAMGLYDDQTRWYFGDGQFLDFGVELQFFKSHYAYQFNQEHRLSVGGQQGQYDYVYDFDFRPEICTDHTPSCRDQRQERIQDKQQLSSFDQQFFIEDQWQFDPSWILTFGQHFNRNEYTNERFSQPRLALEWLYDNDLQFSIRYGEHNQFPDIGKVLRKIGNPDLKSPTAKHLQLGTQVEFGNGWSITSEVYQKKTKALPLALEPTDIDFEQFYSNDLSGDAYGVELLLRKEKVEQWYGWFSASWSRTQRTNERTGITKDYYLETPLVINGVAQYYLTDRWNIGARLTLRSGQRYTPIVGVRENPDYPDRYIPVYGDLNSKTLPYYARMDVRAEFAFQFWGADAWLTFDVLNVLNRKNVSGYFYEATTEDSETDFEIKEESGMPFFPSVGIKIVF